MRKPEEPKESLSMDLVMRGEEAREILTGLGLEKRGGRIRVVDRAESLSLVDRGLSLGIVVKRKGMLEIDTKHAAVRMALQEHGPFWSDLDMDVEESEDRAVNKLLKKHGSLLDVHDVTEIRPYLILTGRKFAAQHGDILHSEHNITHHVNAAVELTVAPRLKPKYMAVNISYRQKDPLGQIKKFHEAADFIQRCRETGGRCLVNCMRGRSRSVAIVLFYLMKHEDMSLKEAYIHVKNKRPLAGPSKHLQPQLHAMEIALRGQASFEPGKKWVDQFD